MGYGVGYGVGWVMDWSWQQDTVPASPSARCGCGVSYGVGYGMGYRVNYGVGYGVSYGVGYVLEAGHSARLPRCQMWLWGRAGSRADVLQSCFGYRAGRLQSCFGYNTSFCVCAMDLLGFSLLTLLSRFKSARTICPTCALHQGWVWCLGWASLHH